MPFKEISIRPELSSPTPFRIQGVNQSMTDKRKSSCLILDYSYNKSDSFNNSDPLNDNDSWKAMTILEWLAVWSLARSGLDYSTSLWLYLILSQFISEWLCPPDDWFVEYHIGTRLERTNEPFNIFFFKQVLWLADPGKATN